MSRVIVTMELAQPGMSVMRGRDWCYNNQDGGPGNKGTILSKEGASGIRVKWGNGQSYYYRAGNGAFDLYIYVPEKKEKEKDELVKEGITHSKVSPLTVGSAVFLKSLDYMWVSEAKLQLDVPYVVNEETTYSFRVKGSNIWIEKKAFMSHAEWLTQQESKRSVLKADHHPIEKVRRELMEMSEMSKTPVDYFKSNTNQNDNNRNSSRSKSEYSGSTLILPSKTITLKRGERPQGRRLES